MDLKEEDILGEKIHGHWYYVSKGRAMRKFLGDSTVVFWLRRGATSSRHDRLLLGEQVAKDIFQPLPELEVLVGIQDHGLHECLGLLTTRFPNGFDGQAPFRQ